MREFFIHVLVEFVGKNVLLPLECRTGLYAFRQDARRAVGMNMFGPFRGDFCRYLNKWSIVSVCPFRTDKAGTPQVLPRTWISFSAVGVLLQGE